MKRKVYYPKAIAKLGVLLHNYGQGEQSKAYIHTVIPESVVVNKNSYQQADDFSLTLRFEDLPFDPRLARSILVNIAIMDIKSLSGFTDKDFYSNLLFRGFADSHNVTLESQQRIVTFEGRDYTALFIDAPFDNASLPDDTGERKTTISLNRPVKTIVQDLISNLPAVKNIKIRDETNGKQLSNFGSAVPAYDLVNGLKSTSGDFNHINPNRTYWDAVVSLCEAAGMICYIDLDELVLTTPRILELGGPSGNKKPTIQMIYGHNITSLNFHKNLGKKRKFNIVVRSFDPVTEKALVVTIPRDATSEWSNAMDIPKKLVKVAELDTNGIKVERDAPFFTFYALQTHTTEGLVDIGEKIFTEFMRQQLEGSLETHDMTTVSHELGKKPVEYDITKIKTGTPVKIEILLDDIQNLLRFNSKGEKISNEKRQNEMKKKFNYLKRKGYDQRVSSLIVRALAAGSGKLRPTFYTREATFRMDSRGFTMRIGFVNFVQIDLKTIGG